MIVDASPLILFAKLNRLGLLEKLFGRLFIPREVYREVVEKGRGYPDARLIKEAIEQGKIIVKQLKPKFQQKAEFLLQAYSVLDRGEAETIALALQEQSKEIVIDEKAAVQVARLHNLKVFGSLAVLLRSYDRNLLTEVEIKSTLSQLLEHKFRMSGEVIHTFWILFEKLKSKKSRK